MTRLVYVEPGGNRREINALDGLSVMEVALLHNVQGIIATCGGSCSCSTCHAHVDPDWVERLDPPDDMELGTLEAAPGHDATSRLTCQLRVAPALDGLVLHIPAKQA
jgi:ferredoxin, 2Fe-2S